jgi:hypothetical protein
MKHETSGPDAGPTAPAAGAPARKPRGPDPLSIAHRRRMLAALNRATGDGDVSAQAALIELSLAAARDAQIAAVLAQLKADGSADGAGDA